MTKSKVISFGTAAISGLAMAVIAQTAGAERLSTSAESEHSVVHRVTHSIASVSSYSPTTNGFKWAKETSNSPSSVHAWSAADSTPTSGFKWKKTNQQSAQNRSHVEALTQTGSTNIAEQAGYRWGVLNFSEQAGNRWGVRNFSEQAGFRWGVRSFSEQAGNRWGVRNFSEQAGFRWGVRGFSEQTGNRWGVR